MKTGDRFIFNLTPHPIHILDEDNKIIRAYPTSGSVARVGVINTKKGFTIDDIPVFSKEFTEAINVPEYKFGTFYIVSQIVKAALPNRDDLIVPDDIVRDNVGNIIGCRSFSI